jgi:hypothetical protein
VLKRRFRHAQQLIGENSRNVAVGFLKISRYYFECGVHRSPPPLENSTPALFFSSLFPQFPQNFIIDGAEIKYCLGSKPPKFSQVIPLLFVKTLEIDSTDIFITFVGRSAKI